MSDLMDKLGKKQNSSAEGAAKAAPGTPESTPTVRLEVDRGTDMLKKAGTNTTDSTTAVSSQASADNKPASSKVEPSGTDIVEDPESWTKESTLKEVKKLRDENKTYRLKYQEQIEKLKQEADLRLQAKEEEMKSLLEAQKELARIKSEQEDKKRSLEEKLAHRESKVTELQGVMDAKEKEYQRKMAELEAIAHTYKAKEEAEKQIYTQRISEELNKIPEKYREIANMIVKGAGEDPRDGLLALNEASLKGVFEDKTVVVNHSVPGAKDGARVGKEKLDEIARDSRSKMSSQQKIRSALDAMKSGTPNSAFRQK